MTYDDERFDGPDEDDLATLPRDPEAPEEDTLDQHREVGPPSASRGEVSRAPDAPEGDAIDQAIEVPLDAEDDAEG